MPKRPGNWELLDKKEDPVIADLEAIDSRVAQYRKIAEMMETEAQRLRRISDGQALAGKYADELRNASGEVANNLQQVVGRYQAVVGAITTYVPTLEAALVESAAALDDAVTADQARVLANAMPTFIAIDAKVKTYNGAKVTGRPDSGALKQEQERAHQESANQNKERAEQNAADALSAAKARLARTLDELTSAGQRAARQIRGSFNDGLTDSRGDRILFGFLKFLKIFVRVLMYVGMAVALVALFIPGVNVVAMAAISAGVGAVALAGQIGLAATGNGSWLDVILTTVGLVTLGTSRFFSAGFKLSFRSGLRKTIPTTRSPSPAKATSPSAPFRSSIFRRLPPGPPHPGTRVTMGYRSPIRPASSVNSSPIRPASSVNNSPIRPSSSVYSRRTSYDSALDYYLRTPSVSSAASSTSVSILSLPRGARGILPGSRFSSSSSFTSLGAARAPLDAAAVTSRLSGLTGLGRVGPRATIIADRVFAPVALTTGNYASRFGQNAIGQLGVNDAAAVVRNFNLVTNSGVGISTASMVGARSAGAVHAGLGTFSNFVFPALYTADVVPGFFRNANNALTINTDVVYHKPGDFNAVFRTFGDFDALSRT